MVLNRELKPAANADEREQALVARIAGGDKAALEEFYLIYHRRLARFLTRVIRDYELAQEIINDTMFIVWQQALKFRGASRVSTWIMGIAYRRALKSLRRAVNTQPLLDEPEQAGPDEIEQMALQEQCARALATLPLEQRLAVELTYYLGHSCEEIAAIMDCPVNTVQTRVFHARRKLRALLE